MRVKAALRRRLNEQQRANEQWQWEQLHTPPHNQVQDVQEASPVQLQPAPGSSSAVQDEEVKERLAAAEFHLNILIVGNEGQLAKGGHSTPGRKKGAEPESVLKPEWRCKLGSLEFVLATPFTNWPTEQDLLKNEQFRIYITPEDEADLSFVYFHLGPCDKRLFFLLSTPDVSLLEGLAPNKKNLELTFNYQDKCNIDVASGRLVIDVCVSESSLFKLSHPSDIVFKLSPSVRKTLKHFMKKLTNIDHDELADSQEGAVTKPDIDQLYEVIKAHHEAKQTEAEQLQLDPQHVSLLPTLRPYQKQAVRWMLGQERRPPPTNSHLHPLYLEIMTGDGTPLYYNRFGGFLVKDRPPMQPIQPGGILADEMGLGKTVEVLACMLGNPRPDVPRPDPLEPIMFKDKAKKQRRKLRSPSPTEFHVKNMEQLDGNASSSDVSDSGDEDATKSSQSDKSNNEVAEEMSDSDTDYEPTMARRKATKRKLPSRGPNTPAPEIPCKVAKGNRSTKGSSSISSQIQEKPFDPISVLEGRSVNAKSRIADKILYAVVYQGKKSNQTQVSVNAIKNALMTLFGQKQNAASNKIINRELVALLTQGKLLNTSGGKGASGSFMVNPEFDSFDSRGMYAHKPLGSIDRVLESVITRICYDGEPFQEKKSPAQIKMEQSLKQKKKSASLYDKLRPLYEREMADMSETRELSAEVKKARRQWNGTFFDTKAEQQAYFECICGSDLDEAYDTKHRVQCTVCSLWQHSECVKYDIADRYRGPYICPHCWTLQPPVESGATLIVSPTTISYQWIEEIQKHLCKKDVKMLFYKGTKTSGYIQPRTLAGYDIVITTYTVLQSETSYIDLPHSNSSEGRRFRNPKRFMAIPAPLLCVNWWRICLDEAQMIENSTTKTAEMALRLSAINRWCVTGTPIGKSLNDLHGLLVFLQLDPYCLDYWWQQCLSKPYFCGDRRPLENVLSSIMWRTAKKDVLHQIDIPLQTEELHWLHFSPVEEHFYRRQFIECSKEMVARINKCSNLQMKLSMMDRQSLQQLLLPLLKLRQSCCHPQAVRGQFMSLQKSTMSMEELLEQMIKKVTVECEESNRQYIGSMNGLAGIDIINEKWSSAADKYREILRFVDEHTQRIKTDTLQKLHTITNLSEVLTVSPISIAPTLRDQELGKQAEDLRQKYLKKYSVALEVAIEAAQTLTTQVESLRCGFRCHSSSKASQDQGAWYVEVIDGLSRHNFEEDEATFLKLVHNELAEFYDVVNDRELKQIEQKYSSSRMVLYKVCDKISEFDGMRQRVTSELDRLRARSATDFLSTAVDCHLRRQVTLQKEKRKCELCQAHDDIEVYESVLFHFVKGDIQVFQGAARQTLSQEENQKLEEAGVFLYDEQRKGTWADSEVERLLKAILKFARQRGADAKVLDDGLTHVKLIEAMKKEFRLLRILWRQIYDQVAAVDELNMSIMRLRLRYEDEPVVSQGSLKRSRNHGTTQDKDKLETIYILEPHEVDAQTFKLISDKTVASAEFKKKYGQLLYLENLRHSDYSKRGGGENPEPCPICQKALGRQWSVLQCGHCFCVECIRILMKDFSIGNRRHSVKCAICRSLTFHSEISYVNTKQELSSPEENTAYETVKGSLSTKIEAVVSTLIRIQMGDRTAKSLVFSTWNDVLEILATALTENDIPFATLHTQGKFKRNLQKFKNRDDVRVLLLPVTSGANGLNLIEASHVLLVEPILNPAQELQAIGRVHRIGQTKPTVVHKFLIKSTIEEKMHTMLSGYHHHHTEQGSHSTEENLLTVADLKYLCT